MTSQSGNSSLKALIHAVLDSLREGLGKPGLVVLSTCLGFVIWGPLGRPLFSPWLASWMAEDPAAFGFRRKLVSYVTGFALLVVVPLLLIRFRFREPLRNFGLGLGDVRLGIVFAIAFIAVTIVPFYFTTRNEVMWASYPMLYAGMTLEQIRAVFSWSSFLVYELVYASFFFVIEFVFRGYMLFGLKDRLGGPLSVLVQTLPYTIWHLAKPLPELLPTPIWGLVTGAAALRIGSMWYIFVAHWLLNVFLDTLILFQRGVF